MVSIWTKLALVLTLMLDPITLVIVRSIWGMNGDIEEGATQKKYVRDLKKSPVARKQSFTCNFNSSGNARLMFVSPFWMDGRTQSNTSRNAAPLIYSNSCTTLNLLIPVPGSSIAPLEASRRRIQFCVQTRFFLQNFLHRSTCGDASSIVIVYCCSTTSTWDIAANVSVLLLSVKHLLFHIHRQVCLQDSRVCFHKLYTRRHDPLHIYNNM